MSTVSVTLPSDGQTIDAADYNVPINTIVTELNGNLNSQNIAESGVTPNSLFTGTGNSWVWQDWTPTWTNVTIGSATVTAKYIQIGKTVHFKLKVVWAANTSASGSQIFSLPVTAAADEVHSTGVNMIGVANALDSGTNNFNGMTSIVSTTTATVNAQISSGGFTNPSGFTNTIPMTWTTNDVLACQGTYEAA